MCALTDIERLDVIIFLKKISNINIYMRGLLAKGPVRCKGRITIPDSPTKGTQRTKRENGSLLS
jgi:hypothetical protein